MERKMLLKKDHLSALWTKERSMGWWWMGQAYYWLLTARDLVHSFSLSKKKSMSSAI